LLHNQTINIILSTGEFFGFQIAGKIDNNILSFGLVLVLMELLSIFGDLGPKIAYHPEK
jgi:hypothetical protein